MPAKLEPIDRHEAARFGLVREHLKLTQKDLAVGLKTTQKNISDMERGVRGISRKYIKTLFKKYNISPIYIIVGGVSIEHKQETRTLVSDLGKLREEIEIMKAELLKMQGDIKILSRG